MTYESEKRDITIALTGDFMLTRRLSVYREPQFLGLRELLRSSDVAFTNFESSSREFDEGAAAMGAGTCMNTDPELLDDIKWLGINLMSCANNHVSDFGQQGLLATARHLDEHGIIYSGIGRNLREARSPAYLDTNGGRVALISANSFRFENSQAGDQRPDFGGRPGVNPLGFQTKHIVDNRAVDDLKRISADLGFDATRERLKNFGFYSAAEVGSDSNKELTFLGRKFVAGDRFATETRANKKDATDNLRQIREARRQADWVVVSLHHHELTGPNFLTARIPTELEECESFIKDFARQCIDEGADVVVGHGPHVTLGMELYKGKPIFDSLGTFVLQNETVRFFPAHAYSRFGLDSDSTPADFLDARSHNDTKAHPGDPLYWQTVCAVCKFTSGKLAQVQLHPIDLGHGKPRAQRGRPVLAEGALAEETIARLARISKPMGADIRLENGVGVVGVN